MYHTQIHKDDSCSGLCPWDQAVPKKTGTQKKRVTKRQKNKKQETEPAHPKMRNVAFLLPLLWSASVEKGVVGKGTADKKRILPKETFQSPCVASLFFFFENIFPLCTTTRVSRRKDVVAKLRAEK